jgi:hypothetical protein
MIRKSLFLLALALAAAAVAAPIAQAQADPPQGHVTIPAWLAHIQYPGTSSEPTVYMAGSVPIPHGLARTQYPGTSAEPSVLVAPVADAPKVDPLAVGYLIGQGLSPSEVASWTTGACSQPAKAASCFAMFRSTAVSKPVDPLAVGYLTGLGLSPSEVTSWTTGACSQPARAASCFAMLTPAAGSGQIGRSIGFQWGDAGIGAGFTLGMLLLIGGVGAGLLISRKNRRRQVAHA